MKLKCSKCGAEFEARRVARCPNCGERLDLKPIYSHAKPRAS